MIVKLLTERHLEFLSEAAEACPSLHMSNWHIVGNLMHWLKSYSTCICLISGSGFELPVPDTKKQSIKR